MKKILSSISCCFLLAVSQGQALSVDELFNLGSVAVNKIDTWLSRKGFGVAGKGNLDDTMVKLYDYRRTRHFQEVDSITRSLKLTTVKDEGFATYTTASRNEYESILIKLKADNFIGLEPDSANAPQFFQHNDLTVQTYVATEDSITNYSLQFYKKKFPGARDIHFAEDLLTFTSHEYLVYYFGQKNVKKDIYFFAGNDLAKCSVLFINTNRQVVFIWGDQQNRCKVASILLGGQQNLKSTQESESYVRENAWVLRSGVRPGMSLPELRKLNQNDFWFYGGNSNNTGCIIPNDNCKLDFKREEIVLSCLNCNDEKFTTARMVNSDESIREGKILFVLSVVLYPL